MQWIEIAAALLGVVNVALVVRRSIWNYPFAIAMVALYFFVFVDAKLYSDSLLQIFFLVINLYGWWELVAQYAVDAGVAVERLRPGQRWAWLAGTAAASLVWGLGMARFTDAGGAVRGCDHRRAERVGADPAIAAQIRKLAAVGGGRRAGDRAVPVSRPACDGGALRPVPGAGGGRGWSPGGRKLPRAA